MPTPVTMPQLDPSVTEAIIGEWLKQIGDHVEKDDLLAIIETAKVTAELPSPVAGRITKLLASVGETVAVGAQIVLIEEHTVPTGQPPVASFTVIPLQGPAPLTIVLNAASSSDPDGTIVQYDWDFGDTSLSSGVTSSHTYVHSGTFTVKLTVTDDGGATNSTSSTITVN